MNIVLLFVLLFIQYRKCKNTQHRQALLILLVYLLQLLGWKIFQSDKLKQQTVLHLKNDNVIFFSLLEQEDFFQKEWFSLNINFFSFNKICYQLSLLKHSKWFLFHYLKILQFFFVVENKKSNTSKFMCNCLKITKKIILFKSCSKLPTW